MGLVLIFCASRFGAIPVYSALEPSRINLPANHYDLIWVGSLFTHLDAVRWRSFLTFLGSVLKPGGLLVFSTQGRQAYEWMTRGQYTYGLDAEQVRRISRQFRMKGFGYEDYRDQPNYGITLTEPAWACRMITSLPQMRLVGYGERCWDGHHDVVACVKEAAWDVASTPEAGLSGSLLAAEIFDIQGALEFGRRVFLGRRSA